jgi:hypothetical protein
VAVEAPVTQKGQRGTPGRLCDAVVSGLGRLEREQGAALASIGPLVIRSDHALGIESRLFGIPLTHAAHGDFVNNHTPSSFEQH